MRKYRKRKSNGVVQKAHQDRGILDMRNPQPIVKRTVSDRYSNLDMPMAQDIKGGGLSGLELGVSGLKISSGYIYEEFLPELRGSRAIKVYKEMSENDAVINAILYAIKMAVRAVPWDVERCEPEDDSNEAMNAVDWLYGALFEDLNRPFDEFISEVLSMLIYGWSLFEIVYKRRIGPYENDPKRHSQFSDGRIGIRKLALRSQDSLDKWDMDENGDILGFHQDPSSFSPSFSAGKRGSIFIPYNKFLLFRPETFKNNPEGRSILRGAYRSWYYYKNIQNIEAISIERELAGLPVLRLPNSLLNSTNATDVSILATYTKMIRDLKLNEQGGIIIPSDTFKNQDGQLSSVPKVQFELMTSGGTRAIDTTKVLARYEFAMSRVVLADFVMLGTSEKGSYALSKTKSDMFFNGLKGWMEMIASVINRNLIPRLWRINGFDPMYMPKVRPGRMAIENLEEISTFIKTLTDAGALMFPDDSLETYLRDIAGLPERSTEVDLYEEEAQRLQAAQEAQAQAAANAAPQESNDGEDPEDPEPDDEMEAEEE